MITMYVVKSKYVLTRDVNPIWTHYSVSELENAVNPIDHIITFDTWRSEVLSDNPWLCDIIYLPKNNQMTTNIK